MSLSLCSCQGASLQRLPVGARLLPPVDSSLERGVRFRCFSWFERWPVFWSCLDISCFFWGDGILPSSTGIVIGHYKNPFGTNEHNGMSWGFWTLLIWHGFFLGETIDGSEIWPWDQLRAPSFCDQVSYYGHYDVLYFWFTYIHLFYIRISTCIYMYLQTNCAYTHTSACIYIEIGVYIHRNLRVFAYNIRLWDFTFIYQLVCVGLPGLWTNRRTKPPSPSNLKSA